MPTSNINIETIPHLLDWNQETNRVKIVRVIDGKVLFDEDFGTFEKAEEKFLELANKYKH